MHVLREKNHKVRYFMVSILILLSVITGCDDVAIKGADQVESIGQIAVAATNASEGVLIIREYVSDQNSWEYTEAKKLYGESQSAFNGWIEQFKADLVFDVEPSAENYEAMLTDAVQKTDAFLQHVDMVKQAHLSRGSGTSNVESDSSERDDVSVAILITAIKTIGPIIIQFAPDAIEIWKDMKAASEQERESQIEYLDTLKWTSFEFYSD